jgi:hypothetical protein
MICKKIKHPYRDEKENQKLPKGDKRSIRDLLSKRPSQDPSAYASSRRRKQKRTGRQDTRDVGQPEVAARTDTSAEIADIINEDKESNNTPKIGKKLCFLSSPPKSRLGESKEDWAMRFLEKIANDLEGAANGDD